MGFIPGVVIPLNALLLGLRPGKVKQGNLIDDVTKDACFHDPYRERRSLVTAARN